MFLAIGVIIGLAMLMDKNQNNKKGGIDYETENVK